MKLDFWDKIWFSIIGIAVFVLSINLYLVAVERMFSLSKYLLVLAILIGVALAQWTNQGVENES